ncbi:diguanylate cyclase [Gemmatirosa kalamazoonensis]|uniref:Diguanylate cyclase n=1 Tax=Gemmatirosa kalamazoonensis TaxID=861299 RepID=W0RG80_9BACT|nr:GGDEF domain-containing protein [Gemmatirosa kalamazoonensis]AHG89781.1 diguanylate cyclase [Gemmatirosa kalamazoonensis]
MRSWSDPLISASLRDDSAILSRARLTVQLSMVLVVTAAGYAAFYAAVVGFRSGAIVLAAGAGAASIGLAMLRLRPWLRAAGHTLTCVLYATIAALMCHEGGLESLATPWLIMPPIFAVLLLGRREAAGWAALSVLTVGAFRAAEASGVTFPVDYPAAWAHTLTMGSHAGLVLCTALLLFVFENIRATAQARAESASAALARLAYHDALTGLANRARFLECLDGAVTEARAAGDHARVAVLLLDLDGFKGVNDSMGHAAGDALLVEVAARLLNATRGCDTVSRLGGDEFAVLLGGVRHDEDAIAVARRIVASIAAPFALQGREVCVGASVGIARAEDVAAAAARVLHDADVAMYRAKARGRGRWVRHARGMEDERVEPQATSAPAAARLVIA